MLTEQDTGPEALKAWAQINGVTDEALCLALGKMADQSIECLLEEMDARDRGDPQNIVEMCDRQELKNYFIEQIRFIPVIHQYMGAVVGANKDGLLTPLYRQARIDPRQKTPVNPWQNPDWVAAQWAEYFLSRETEDAEESAYRSDRTR